MALVGTTVDTSARKKIRDLVEHSHDPSYIHNLESRLLLIDELPAKILGYSRDEILNTPMKEFILPEAHGEFDECLSRI